MRKWWRSKRLGGLTVLFAALTGLAVLFAGKALAITAAGTRIANTASLSCTIGGEPRSSRSNTVFAEIQQVNRLSFSSPLLGNVRPGRSVSFSHTLSNRGNVQDSFKLQLTCAEGFSARIFAADGVTPLTDSNGDGAIDTGVMAGGAELAIVVKLAAPETAKPGDVAVIIIKGSSTVDPAVSAMVADTATVINPAFTTSQTVTPQGQVTQKTVLTYHFNFATDQSTSATNVVITDPLDQNVDYQEGSATTPQGAKEATTSYDAAARTVTWKIPTIPAGYKGSVRVQAVVNAAARTDTTIYNTIRISSDEYPEAKASNIVATPVVEQPLRVMITAGKSEAEVGELVAYTVTAENTSKTLLARNVEVIGLLPRGFRYAKGSSSLDDLPSADPAKGGTLAWPIGDLEPGQMKKLLYRAVLSIDAEKGDGINTVSSVGTTPGGNRLASPPASVKVKVLEGVLNSKAIILGRVFDDLNGNLLPDEDEPGLRGVRLYLENGYFAVTDEEGKFSIVSVDPGEHVLKLDKSTLPPGYLPVPLDSTFAGDGGSRFITMPFGGMARGDFGVRQVKKEPAVKREEQKTAAKAKEERVLTFGTRINSRAPTLEEQIATMPDSPEILQPAPGSVLRKRWCDIVIRVPDGADYSLRVNDVPLLQKQIGKTIVEPNRKIRICQYVSVDLEPGKNKVVLEVTREGLAPEAREIEIITPGDAVKVEISPDKSDIPADGKTTVPFTVSFLDREGRPVGGDILYSVLLEKGEIVEPDLDKDKPGHQLKAVDGKGGFTLRSTQKSGADRIKVVAGTSLVGGADLFFTPELRDWIVVGLGSLTVGSNSVTGNVERLSNDDQFESGIYEEGRLAFFARGKILGKYLLTAAVDTDKEKRSELFQRVDPNKYYPIYGDASVQGYEAESQRKYYVKIEKDRSSVLVGDFNTELSSNEFSRYDRSFNGVKADLDSRHATLRAFGTSTSHSANKDEIQGNGTSGYYFLSRRPIIENSDKIRIETRDRYHSERILAVAEKAPYTDYSLDYRTGALLFREPVPSYDQNLNPIRIVALYESEDTRDDNYTYGGRGAIRSDNGSELGATAVVEENGAGTNSLYGVDAAWRVNDKTALKMEAAKSDTLEKGDGTAFKTEASAGIGKAAIEAYYRQVGRNFRNLSMTGSETGTEKYGTKVKYSLLEKTTLIADAFVQSDFLSNTRLTHTSLGVSQQVKKYTVDAGYRYVRGDDGEGHEVSTSMLFSGVSGKLTEKLEGSLLQEQAFVSDTVRDYPSRTLLKLNYKLSEGTSAFLTDEYKESGINKGNNALLGITSKLYDNLVLTTTYRESSGFSPSSELGTELSSRWEVSKELSFATRSGYRIQDTMTGDRGQALLGVESSWEAMKGLKVGVKAERVQLVTGRNDPAGINTAFALSAAYLGNENMKSTARYEYRVSPGETAHLASVGGAWKLTRSVSLLGKGTFWSSAKAYGTDTLFDGEIAGAYRPPGPNSLYLLGLIRFKEDKKGSSPAGDKIDSLIGSLEFSERLRAYLTFHGKYAGKYSQDALYGQQVDTYSDLLLAGATFDLTERWDLDLSGKVMNQYASKVVSIGLIPQVGFRVHKNARLALGYNFSKLNDRDLASEGYGSSGPFIQLKVKFDESSIEEIYAGLTSKPAVKEVAAPPPPPPPPEKPMAVVRATATGQPVEILGSVEALKVMVNDHETTFPTGDVTLAMEGVDDIVERNGGDAEKPLYFQLQGSSPEKIVSWRVEISDLKGEPVGRVQGKGAPKEPVAFGVREGMNALKGGEIYRYRAQIEYADGSRITSPSRLFGLNRTSSVGVSLTGSAFETGSAVLSRKAKEILTETAVLLRKHPEEKFVVEGHTDSVGSDESNMELSRKRSQAAADYLVQEEKIPAERLIVRWYGKTRPIASNAIPEGRELNRRVEIKGEFSETRKAVLMQQHRESPFVRIDGNPVETDDLGRFARTLSEKSERVDIEMGNRDGRSVKGIIPLPVLALTEPGSKGARVPVAAELKLSHSFSGKTAPGTTVTLNGVELPVAQDGSFSFTLELAEGTTGYWLQLRNSQGNAKHFRLWVSVEKEKKKGTAANGGKEAVNAAPPATPGNTAGKGMVP